MARLFDSATNTYLECATTPVTDVPMTLACWFRKPASETDPCALMSVSANATNYFTLWIEESNYLLANQRGSANEAATTTTTCGDNTWHHVCGIFASTTSRSVFLDAAGKGTDTTLVTTYTCDQVGISEYTQGGGYALTGAVAEAAIWNVALTDAEVAILAKGFSPLLVRPENLVAYWPLIRDTDDDIVGGYSMTAYNTPTVADHPKVFYPTAAIIGKSGVVPEVRIPRPPAAYNTLAVY